MLPPQLGPAPGQRPAPNFQTLNAFNDELVRLQGLMDGLISKQNLQNPAFSEPEEVIYFIPVRCV